MAVQAVAMEPVKADMRLPSSSCSNTTPELNTQEVCAGSIAHMPLPEFRMLGNAVLAAQDSGKLPEKLLLLSAMMVSLENGFTPPHSAGRAPSRLLSVSVSSLQEPEDV